MRLSLRTSAVSVAVYFACAFTASSIAGENESAHQSHPIQRVTNTATLRRALVPHGERLNSELRELVTTLGKDGPEALKTPDRGRLGLFSHARRAAIFMDVNRGQFPNWRLFDLGQRADKTPLHALNIHSGTARDVEYLAALMGSNTLVRRLSGHVHHTVRHRTDVMSAVRQIASDEHSGIIVPWLAELPSFEGAQESLPDDDDYVVQLSDIDPRVSALKGVVSRIAEVLPRRVIRAAALAAVAFGLHGKPAPAQETRFQPPEIGSVVVVTDAAPEAKPRYWNETVTYGPARLGAGKFRIVRSEVVGDTAIIETEQQVTVNGERQTKLSTYTRPHGWTRAGRTKFAKRFGESVARSGWGAVQESISANAVVVANPKPTEVDYDALLEKAVQRVVEHPNAPGNTEDLYWQLGNGLVSALDDPNSGLLTTQDMNAVMGNLHNEPTIGIGVHLLLLPGEDHLRVTGTLRGSPAASSLQRGDIILDASDDPSAHRYQTTFPPATVVMNRLSGKPNTNVTLLVEREGKRIPLTIPRVHYQPRLVTVETVDPQHGVLKLDIQEYVEGAADQARHEFAQAIAGLSVPPSGVVIDLRRCPGGSLPEGIAVADLFLSGGKSICTLSSRRVSTPNWSTNATDDLGRMLEKVPVVGLCDQDTASSAEITLGALKGNGRLKSLIGRRTYGKATVQELRFAPREFDAVRLPLAFGPDEVVPADEYPTFADLQAIVANSGRGLRFTVQTISSPGGIGFYHHQGIEPDTEVSREAHKQWLLGGEDTMLNQAVEQLRAQ